MAQSINRVTLLGRLGRDPEVRNFQGGGKVCNLNVATSEKWKDKATGEQKERTQWHTVVIFVEGLVGVAEKYLHKGDPVYVEGSLETRKWQDKSGADRYSTEVVIRPFGGQLVLLGKSQSSSAATSSAPAEGSGRNAYADARDSARPPIVEDEVPF